MDYSMSEVAKRCSDRIAHLDIVSNNLANVATPGFKVEQMVYDGKKEDQTTGNSFFTPSISVDYSQGIIQSTGNPLDLAIQGEGFFVVQTKDGPAYTRKGNFTVNRNNQLMTQTGELVLGEKGAVAVNGGAIDIDKAGNVQVDGVVVDKLRVVQFRNKQSLVRRGDGLFFDNGSSGIQRMGEPDINQRNLETSNVNSVREMVSMIDIQRAFESYQKVILTIADLDKLSTSRVGRLA